MTAAIFLICTLFLFVLGISIVFAIFSAWFSLPFKLVIIALNTWTIVGWSICLRRMFSKSRLWLIENNGLVVGYGLMSHHKTYSILSSLYIVPTHRNQRLGSFLLRGIIEYHNNKPLYLFCQSNLISFYQRFGFVSVSRKQLPLKIRFNLLPALMLNEAVNLLFSSTQIVNNIPALPHNLIISRARKSDRAKICKFIFTSSALDFFLPFGFTSSLASSIFVLVLVLLPFFLIGSAILLLTGIAVPIGKLWAASIMLALLLPLCTLIFACFQMQNWAQFYLVESSSKLIGYARLSRYSQYSILHYLHLSTKSCSSREQLADELFQYLITQLNKPTYLACEAESVNFYKRLGFDTIATSTLPSSLQFGANLNRRFGGDNLVLR
ncbi:MAG: GNAT family N-acetyltransferase [Chroococcus sp. CMT-3BRIN-NPC107]|nr:GNAT family N-acetyltransferase [Chroococcus sp. CMT-3BRIN-NPC107]